MNLTRLHCKAAQLRTRCKWTPIYLPASAT